MKYTKIPADTFKQIQLNAGILVDAFDPATEEIGNIIGATTGGNNFKVDNEYTDYGEDIDNCPKNTKELKKLDTIDAKLTGTFVTVTAGLAKRLVAAGDIDANDAGHIIPRRDLKSEDFKTIWWIGDYSDVNDGSNAGFVAIKLMNALSTGGFEIQSTDKGKGQFAFEFTGHFSMAAQDTVPYEIYIRDGGGAMSPSVLLDRHSASIVDGDTITLVPTVNPSGATVSWTSSNTTYATVAAGVVTAEAEGTAIITASITVDGITYTDTCTIVVEASA